jgi:hypothetical protein
MTIYFVTRTYFDVIYKWVILTGYFYSFIDTYGQMCTPYHNIILYNSVLY